MKIPLGGTANTFSFQFNLDIGTGHKSIQESKWKAFAEKNLLSEKIATSQKMYQFLSWWHSFSCRSLHKFLINLTESVAFKNHYGLYQYDIVYNVWRWRCLDVGKKF